MDRILFIARVIRPQTAHTRRVHELKHDARRRRHAREGRPDCIARTVVVLNRIGVTQFRDFRSHAARRIARADAVVTLDLNVLRLDRRVIRETNIQRSVLIRHRRQRNARGLRINIARLCVQVFDVVSGRALNRAVRTRDECRLLLRTHRNRVTEVRAVESEARARKVIDRVQASQE